MRLQLLLLAGAAAALPQTTLPQTTSSPPLPPALPPLPPLTTQQPNASSPTQGEGPPPPRQSPSPPPAQDEIPSVPVVTIANGTVVGQRIGPVDTFKGIPFAMPPVGPGRLKPPQPLNGNFGIFYATSVPLSCPVLNQAQNPWAFAGVPTAVINEIMTLFPPPYYTGEDCLTLNIQRPSTAKPGDKLPVLFWIYGGGFESGATQIYDFTNVVTLSLQLGHPVIVVQANYRQGAFGFLAGKEISKEGSANLGLMDQRLAMKWVADNIAAFGGDPDKVTIWGQSAGAVSVLYHTLLQGGDNTYNGRPLFRGAIMNSGATQPAFPADSAVADDLYQYVLSRTRCVASPTPLACLRLLPYSEFAYAASFVPALVNLQGLAFSITPRPNPHDSFYNVSAEDALAEKPPRVAKVPILAGVQEDEGTFFAAGLLTAPNANTTKGFVDALSNLYPAAPREVLEKLVVMYPTDPAAGSPFNTGTSNEMYPGYKRNSAVLGDLIFDFHRRAYLEAVADTVPAWSFLNSYRKLPVLGSFHGGDLLMLAERWPLYPYYDTWQYFISFVHYLDPNRISNLEGMRRLGDWPRWENGSRRMLNFFETGEALITDDRRQEAYEYFKANVAGFKI